MEMPNWPALWEREPALRPKQVFVTEGGHLIHEDYNLTDEELADLCAMRAVRWLAEDLMYVAPPCRVSSSPTADWCLYRTGVYPQLVRPLANMRDGRHLSPPPRTYDAALYMACEAVLNERKPALSPPSQPNPKETKP